MTTPVPSDLMQPPYPADGHVHCWVPDGRALARCGYPDSQQACAIANDEQFVLYPQEYQCTVRPDGSDGCARMLAAGVPGPADWPA